MTPTAQQSTQKLWSCRHMTYGAMYPGVPDVSELLNSRYYLAIPKSVILRQPFQSRTKFSGLISRWMISFEWRYYKPRRTQAMKNLVQDSLKLLLLPMQYLRSPPVRRSITRQRHKRSWKAYSMLTMKGCFKPLSSLLSFITESIDFLVIILVFNISFMAYDFLFFFNSTLHTFPNPPFPITQWQMKSCLPIGLSCFYSSFFFFSNMVEMSILNEWCESFSLFVRQELDLLRFSEDCPRLMLRTTDSLRLFCCILIFLEWLDTDPFEMRFAESALDLLFLMCVSRSLSTMVCAY